jgi:hypothetical protein
VDAEQAAELARSLRDNEVFQAALDGLRDDALDRLASLKAREDVDQIIECQATVKVVDNLRADLEQFIRSGRKRKKPGLA